MSASTTSISMTTCLLTALLTLQTLAIVPPGSYELGNAPTPSTTTDRARYISTTMPETTTDGDSSDDQAQGSCTARGWPTVFGTCGASQIDSEEFSRRAKHHHALRSCAAYGLRLCTVREVETVVPLPKNRARNHFRRKFWTLDFCWYRQSRPGFVAASVNGKRTCKPLRGGRASVMCCADL